MNTKICGTVLFFLGFLTIPADCLAGCPEVVIPNGQLPFVAALTSESMTGFCTGILVDSEWVLTAYHCALATFARIGSSSIWDQRDSFEVGDIYSLGGTNATDLALLHLNTRVPAEFSPILIASDSTLLKQNLRVSIAGLNINGCGTTDHLMRTTETEVSFISTETVFETFSNETIAGRGSSGGPVFLRIANEERLVGVMSNAGYNELLASTVGNISLFGFRDAIMDIVSPPPQPRSLGNSQQVFVKVPRGSIIHNLPNEIRLELRRWQDMVEFLKLDSPRLDAVLRGAKP